MEAGLRRRAKAADCDIEIAFLVSPQTPRRTARPVGRSDAQRSTLRVAGSRGGKVRELIKLGTARKTVILTALSRKGPWPLSRTLATQTGMTNQWLTETLGLVSIRALWIALHYPA